MIYWTDFIVGIVLGVFIAYCVSRVTKYFSRNRNTGNI